MSDKIKAVQFKDLEEDYKEFIINIYKNSMFKIMEANNERRFHASETIVILMNMFIDDFADNEPENFSKFSSAIKSKLDLAAKELNISKTLN